jgi:signal transduction histidine kinase
MIVVLALVPGFAIAVVASRTERSDARHEAERSSLDTITEANSRYQDALATGRSLLQTIGLTTPLDTCAPALRAVMAESYEVTNLLILTTSGELVCSAEAPSAYVTDPDQPWFRDAAGGSDLTISNVETDPGTGRTAIVIASAIQEGDSIRGVAVASLDVTRLHRSLSDFEYPDDSTVTLLDGNNAVLLRLPPRPSLPGSRVSDADVVRRLRASGEEGALVARGVDGVSRIYVFRKLAQPPGAVVYAGIPTSVAYADADATFRSRMIGLAIAAAITLLIALMFAELTVIRRARRLVDQATRIGDGDLSARSEVVGSDEIGRLGLALDEMASDLEATEAERAQLTAAVVSAGEAERRRIAADVHDDSIQVMSAHVMQLQLLRRHVQDDPELVARITELEASGRAAIRRLRDLVFELHSPVLEERGLAAAIDALLERSFEGEPTVTMIDNRLEEEPPLPTREVAYRIVQEVIWNARRHAHATRVDVVLHRDGEQLVIEVEDNGVGYEQEEVEGRPGHFGLIGVRERTDAVGGFVDMSSQPGAGTRVVCRLPWVLGRARLRPPVGR